MGILGKLLLGFLGLCILLPGLCFGLFGPEKVPIVMFAYLGVGIVLMIAAGLIVYRELRKPK